MLRPTLRARRVQGRTVKREGLEIESRWPSRTGELPQRFNDKASRAGGLWPSGIEASLVIVSPCSFLIGRFSAHSLSSDCRRKLQGDDRSHVFVSNRCAPPVAGGIAHRDHASRFRWSRTESDGSRQQYGSLQHALPPQQVVRNLEGTGPSPALMTSDLARRSNLESLRLIAKGAGGDRPQVTWRSVERAR